MNAEEIERRLALTGVHFIEPGDLDDVLSPLPSHRYKGPLAPEIWRKIWTPALEAEFGPLHLDIQLGKNA